MFPLRSAVLPGEALPLRGLRTALQALVEDYLQPPGTRPSGVVPHRPRPWVGSGDERGVMTSARSASWSSPTRTRSLSTQMRCAGTIPGRRWLPDDPYPRSRCGTGPTDNDVASADVFRARGRRVGAAGADRRCPRQSGCVPVTRSSAICPTTGGAVVRVGTRVPIEPRRTKYAVLAAPDRCNPAGGPRGRSGPSRRWCGSSCPGTETYSSDGERHSSTVSRILHILLGRPVARHADHHRHGDQRESPSDEHPDVRMPPQPDGSTTGPAAEHLRLVAGVHPATACPGRTTPMAAVSASAEPPENQYSTDDVEARVSFTVDVADPEAMFRTRS